MANVTAQQAQDPDIAEHIRERLMNASKMAHDAKMGTPPSGDAPAPGAQGFVNNAPYQSNAERTDLMSATPRDTVSLVREFAQPRNTIPVLAQTAARALPFGNTPLIQTPVGYAAQIPGTIAQRLLDREPILSPDTLTDIGTNMAFNAVGNAAVKAIPAGAAGVKAIVDKLPGVVTTPLKKVGKAVLHPRRALGEKVFGDVRPGARESFERIEQMTADVETEVNRIRQGQGQPLLSREEILNMTGDALDKIKSQGVMTPATPTTGHVADYLESLGRSSTFTSRRFAELDTNQQLLLKAYAHVYARSLGELVDAPGSTEALAGVLAAKLKDVGERRLGAVRKGYKTLDKIAGADPVTIDNGIISGVLEDMVTLREKLGKALPETEGIGKAIDNVTTLVASTRDKVLGDGSVVSGARYTWKEARQLNSWLKEIRRGLPPEDATGKRVYGDAIGGISTRLEETLARRDAAGAGLGPRKNPNMPQLTLVDLWKKTDKGFKKEIQAQAEIETEVLFGLLKGKHGAQVVPRLLGEQWEGERVKFLYSRLGGSQTTGGTQLRRWLFEDLLARSKGDGKALYRAITEQDGGFSGEARWRAVLGDNHYKDLKSFLDTASFVTAKNPEGNKIGAHIFESQLFLNIPGAAGAGPEGLLKHIARGTTYAITMRGLAKMMTNPATAEALAKGTRGGVGARRSAKILQTAIMRTMAANTLDPSEVDVEIIEMPRTASREDLRERNRAAGAR